ncbi:transmembrane protein 130-like isoform X3 [Acanthaster planci]|uniref:Transmembrane protein 130-like isoform X2 n=1 Tax=Acanthaster planci TaxID=133434 RepID=A0A8B7YLE4_ACAPL|nr:transmembrane protein 130-like isoform X2 [Acanthaster planci]XP_022092327.1 transmembrane protein 130-like isoform X3 [Acanthaster planci]
MLQFCTAEIFFPRPSLINKRDEKDEDCKMAGRMLFAFATVCIQLTSRYTAAEAPTPKVSITNDGPTIVGATTTFTAKLSFVKETHENLPKPFVGRQKPSPTFLYEYVWSQWICGLPSVSKILQNSTCNFTQTYDCSEDVGLHTVTVTVRKNDFILKPFVVSNSTSFQITEHINADLVIKDGVSCNTTFGLETCDIVATNKSVDMVVNIHDPSNFFKDATLLYHWTFGDGSADTTINQPAVSHMYRKPGRYGIMVNMTAIFPDSNIETRPPKTGDVKHNLKTMDAVRNLTIHGKDNLETGVKATYNISCLASLPLEFCWFVIPTTTNAMSKYQSNDMNCNKIMLTNQTWFEVDHWFNTSGGYSIGVYARNAISNSGADKNVYAQSPKKSQEVVGLVIGIFFGIAACFLCVAVFTNYVRNQNRPHVEVANFDFQRQWQRSVTLGTKIRRLLLGGSRAEHLPLSQDFNRNHSV